MQKDLTRVVSHTQLTLKFTAGEALLSTGLLPIAGSALIAIAIRKPRSGGACQSGNLAGFCIDHKIDA